MRGDVQLGLGVRARAHLRAHRRRSSRRADGGVPAGLV
ncbi:hypothetical protein Ae706Ps2_5902 [Pseudonocardia sp. Ae706_Ps2]|nr:hypothetical protein Ae706Ps2_5902 [Pseudonocardia sp. Ae706_Ps2]